MVKKKKNAQYKIPEQFLYKESRDCFTNHVCIRDKKELEEQINNVKLEEDDLRDYLCKKGFPEQKISNGIERAKKSLKKKDQKNMSDFFKKGTVVISNSKNSKEIAA